ncbi:MAG: hypothetical protein ACNA8K_12040 [Cyclonatronaceae bacterium]
MNDIIEKHDSIRDLCDNGWLHLWAMDDNGKVSHRYTKNLTWKNAVHHDIFGTVTPATTIQEPAYVDVS